ncbi:DEAD/DEAH box helicase [Rhodococcus aetherivorans]|uniref:DEAD/DEAH box helicase n=1 Tax=Rhodococcus aetherivorans TaxID=191292 RepID=UPI003C6E2F02
MLTPHHQLSSFEGSTVSEGWSGTNRQSQSIALTRAEIRPELFDYQRDLVDSALEVLSVGSEALLSLPTGGGKTRTGVVACLDALTDFDHNRLVWLAPSNELVDQAFRSFEHLWRLHGRAPDVMLTQSFEKSADRTILVTTPQAAYARLQSGIKLGTWDAVVFDEAHQLAARTYDEAVRELRSQAAACTLRRPGLLGLSATPGRANDEGTQSLVSLFGRRLLKSDRLGKNPVLTLQRRGVLARLEFRRMTKRDLSSQDEIGRIKVAVNAAKSLVGAGRHVLAFTSSVAGAICMAEILRSAGVAARAVHSQMPMQERIDALDSFARYETKILINQRLLATGYDCPAVSDLLLLAPIGSPILFEQIVGRAARGPRTGGGASATVWEFDDHLALHGLPSSYYRYRDYEWS